jgi:hypothetical protein
MQRKLTGVGQLVILVARRQAIADYMVIPLWQKSLKRLLTTLTACVAFSTSSHPAKGQQFAPSQRPDFRFTCAHSISGEITQNTLLELLSRTDAISLAMLDGSSAICLNSEGGNYRAGLEIANLILERSWPTLIDQGSVCFSSCSIIFLAGSRSVGMYNHRLRLLYPGGIVGFHTPYLLTQPGLYSNDEVNTTYAAAIQSIHMMIRFGQRRYRGGLGEVMNQFLIDQTLMTPPSQIWSPRTIHDFALSDIDIWHSSPPRDDSTYINICDNFVAKHGPDGISRTSVTQVQRERLQNRNGRSAVLTDPSHAWVPGYWSDARNTMVCRVNLLPYVYRDAFGENYFVQLVQHDWAHEPPFEADHEHTVELFRSLAPVWYGFRPDHIVH